MRYRYKVLLNMMAIGTLALLGFFTWKGSRSCFPVFQHWKSSGVRFTGSRMAMEMNWDCFIFCAGGGKKERICGGDRSGCCCP